MSYDHQDMLDAIWLSAKVRDDKNNTQAVGDAAVYTAMEMGYFEGLGGPEDDGGLGFEFDWSSYDVSSSPLHMNTFFHRSDLNNDYEPSEGVREFYEALTDLDEGQIRDLGLHLFKNNNPDKEETRAWTSALDELEGRESELDQLYSEIQTQTAS